MIICPKIPQDWRVKFRLGQPPNRWRNFRLCAIAKKQWPRAALGTRAAKHGA